MAIDSRLQVSSGSVNSGYVRDFLQGHRDLNARFGADRATTSDHRTAIEQLSSLYGTVMQDGGLDDQDKTSLAKLMEGTNAAALDAYTDNALAADLGVGLDQGFYTDADADAGRQLVHDAEARQAEITKQADGAPDAGAVDGPDAAEGAEPRRAADGRIIYDAAPSFESVRAGDAQLGIGQKSEEIRDVQRQLFEGGFYEGQYDEGATVDDVADHFFGPKTEAAVKAWQEANGMEATGRLDGDSLDRLLNPEAAEAEDSWFAGPRDDALDAFGVDGQFFEENAADIFAGTTEDHTVRNASGREIFEDHTHVGYGAEYNATVIGASGHVGDAQGTGVEARAAVEADAYAGVEASRGENSASVRGGAYVGVDAVGEASIGLRYFGIGARGSVGAGAGAAGEAYAGAEDGRISVGAYAKAGLGVTTGIGGDLWIDYGQMQRDAEAVGDAISGAWNDAGEAVSDVWNDASSAVSDWWNGLDLSRD